MLRTVFFVAMLASSAVASGQSFSVYTTVQAARDGVVAGPVISRSNTFFHAGRSYDYMEDVGEVVICDPMKRQVILIHRGETGARLAFEELGQFVSVGRNETEKYAVEIAQTPQGGPTAAALQFLLDPTFQTATKDRQLTLTSDYVRYSVELAPESASECAERYADYADTAARLNFVLHPQAFFPAAREALNEELRRAGRIPTRVTFNATVGEPIELVAEHKYRWSLESHDRSLVHRFNSLAESDAIEWLSFRDYQKRLLSSF